MYPLGQQILLTWSPGATTTGTLTITLPDGTTTSPLTNVTASNFTTYYTPVQAGRHLLRWVGVTTNPAAYTDVFEVTGTTAAGLVSLADVKRHLNWPITDVSADAEMLDFIASATDTVEGYLCRPLRRQTFVDVFQGGRNGLPLRHVPCPCSSCAGSRIMSITTVAENGVTLNAGNGDYTLEQSTGILWRGPLVPSALRWISMQPIVVTYVAGTTATPGWAQMAVKRMVEHLWTQSQAPRMERGGASAAEDSPSPIYLLPYMVQSLLDQHRGGGF